MWSVPAIQSMGMKAAAAQAGPGPSPGQLWRLLLLHAQEQREGEEGVRVQRAAEHARPSSGPERYHRVLRAHPRLPHQRRCARVGRSRRGTTARAPGLARWSRARRTSSPCRRTPSAPDTASPATSARAVTARALEHVGATMRGASLAVATDRRAARFRAMQYCFSLTSDMPDR